jgi:ectoine hydroxylase-related dioxygenase (phytanoyl-CoA dioxygenase family)
VGDLISNAVWMTADDCSIDDFQQVIGHGTSLADTPHAVAVELGVVVYDSAQLQPTLQELPGRRAVQAELARALLDGPGIVVFRGAFELDVVDGVSRVFDEMIADERAAGTAVGDHFAPPGANDRVWNALEKLALRDPDLFVDYYSNDVLALISEAWLGPAYQVTSQVNVVNPGGQAQHPHRDFHLGFLSDAVAETYPAHVHRLSPQLTLQGAVAHCDMPVETGPTLYLPHSQKYVPGYLAWRRPEFIEYFDRHHVQLPLAAGDAVFFNPALFHAAGSNHTTDIRRMANLLQVSTAFGRAMESVDRYAMIEAVYPSLLRRQSIGAAPRHIRQAVAACADGYPFPTNLDVDQPIDGLAPPAQADLVSEALEERWSPDRLLSALDRHRQRRISAAGR